MNTDSSTLAADLPLPANDAKTPLETARRTLQRALADRFADSPSARPPGTPPPRVAALGAADALDAAAGQDIALRRAADVHLTAQAVLVGPWGGGASEACGQCLAMRWQRLRSRSERDALETGGRTRLAAPHAATGQGWQPAPCTPPAGWPLFPGYLVDAVWDLYEAVVLAPATPAEEVAGPWGQGDAGLPRVSRIDLETLRVGTFPLLPEPLCPACAPLHPAAEATEPVLRSRPKPAEDTYRLRPVTAYELPSLALANPVCGALGAGTWINVTSPTTSPVAGSVFVRGYAGLSDVTWSGQANSFATSRGLAFLEGLERYAGTHRRRRGPLLVDSYDNLAEAALDPRNCGEYSEETYRDDPMVSPFDPAAAIPWVRGYSLRDERPILVPARLAHYSAGIAADNFVFECSNGCAIGSCLEEAVLHGLLELIERDAFLLAWYGRAELPRIDLDTLDSAVIRGMVDRAALLGYDIHAFDNRIDLPVPVVTALASRRDGGTGRLSFAAGSALEPELAVGAALSEVLTYIPHLPGQVQEERDALEAMANDFSLVRNLSDHPRLFGLPEMAGHAPEYLTPARTLPMAELYGTGRTRGGSGGRPDLLDDVRHCRDALVDAGFDVVVVDQTTPEQERIGLRTVCTIVPGLLPIDFGWSRQRALRSPRLRSAFRRAGWRDTDLSDAEIRRVPHPFP